jgi:hypothetical protein
MFERDERHTRSDRNDRSERGNRFGQLRQVNTQNTAQGVRSGTITSSSSRSGQRPSTPPQLRALAPTGTAPAEVNMTVVSTPPVPLLQEGVYQAEDAPETLSRPLAKTLRLFPFGVNRDRLSEAARHLRVPIVITNNQNDADAVITLKNYYRNQPERLTQFEQERKLIIILKNNTIAQMQHALGRVFDLPTELPVAAAQPEPDGQDVQFDDPTKQALLETEDAIHQVLNKGLTTAELTPANAYIRRLQHQMATRYNLLSRSRGKEPNRYVKIFRSHE